MNSRVKSFLRFGEENINSIKARRSPPRVMQRTLMGTRGEEEGEGVGSGDEDIVRR